MDIIDIINKVEILYNSSGNIIIFLGSFIETLPIGFLIPGGLIVALGGFFSFDEALLHANPIALSRVIISGTLGMTLAFAIGYILGRKTGGYFIKKFHQEKNARVAKDLLKTHGPVILTTSLLANLIRFWVSFVCGIEKYSFPKFIFYATVASLTWNSLLVAIGYLAGSERQQLENGIAKLGVFSWVMVLIATLIIYWNVRREYKLFKQ